MCTARSKREATTYAQPDRLEQRLRGLLDRQAILVPYRGARLCVCVCARVCAMLCFFLCFIVIKKNKTW